MWPGFSERNDLVFFPPSNTDSLSSLSAGDEH